MISRLIVGNLAAEVEMARAATPGPHRDVDPGVVHRIARAAAHLGVFAADHLWLPGDSWPPPPATQILAWAETDSVAALRGPDPDPHPDPDPGSWQQRLWQLHPDPATARACNHRRFAFELAQQNGWSLPDARIIRSLDEIGVPSESIVLKAPFSAAGRERICLAGRSPEPPERTRIERLLARFGELLLEPWVDRVLDLGCSGLVGDRLEVFPPHRADCDHRGVFRAAVIDDAGHSLAEGSVLAAVRDTAQAAGEALAAAGYRGPFSVDAYQWRDRRGATHLQRLSEINARLTFGLVARAAAEREAGGGRFELRL
jgi:hypothetical protein